MFHVNSRKDSDSYSINFPQKTIILNGGMQVIVPQSSDAESTRTSSEDLTEIKTRAKGAHF